MTSAVNAAACAPLQACCEPGPSRAARESPGQMATIRAYLEDVYPMGSLGPGGSATDAEASGLFRSRHWYYAGAPGLVRDEELLSQLPLVRAPRHECTDGFFRGLWQTDTQSRFPQILPCRPGEDCVRRQASHLPHCAAELAQRGSDLWVEVWHLAWDGRTSKSRPTRPSELLDHGPAGWWYVHAPGSGIFYHAGRSLAAPSKAAMLAKLLEEWAAKPEAQSEANRVGGKGGKGGRHAGGSKGGGGGGTATGGADEGAVDAATVKHLHRLMGEKPLDLARRLRMIESGIPCHNVSWGRWRCVGDRIPSDNWDPLLVALGRALGYDSLFMTALMWGRALGAYKDLLAIASGHPPWMATPPVPPSALPPTWSAELTAEWLDLRRPPPPWDRSKLLSEAAGAEREALAHAWTAQLLHSTPPRLSLRDPLHPADAARMLPCAFNASGGPTMRLACYGHLSWHVRHETQRQQGCTDRCAPHVGESPLGRRVPPLPKEQCSPCPRGARSCSGRAVT